MQVLVLVARLLWAAFVIATPVLGVWVGSSIAAYLNKPVWVAMASGLLLFPGLPIAWELFAVWRKGRRDARQTRQTADRGAAFEPRKPFLKPVDRIILRTLFINLAFLVGLLWFYPQHGFEALSTRGDWMLDGRNGDSAERTRKRLFWTAEKLAWLYDSLKDNPFRQFADDEPGGDDVPDPTPTPQPDPAPDPDGDPAPDPDGDSTSDPTPDSTGDPGGDDRPDSRRSRAWPLAATLHPAVKSLPPDHETSIESVARYLVDREDDPYFLVKALHDYVADRIAYDAPAYVEGRYPPQDAETVFQTRVGVCAGYAKLLSALGRAAGVTIIYVVGDARTQGWDLSGEGHAWNAVEIEGQWYLIDATWNAGSVSGKTFTKGYGTEYLFTPASVFGITHYPDDEKWQLRTDPLSRGEFMRQPVLSPGFYANGLELVNPRRSQVTVSNGIEIEIRNPRGKYLLATWSATHSSDRGEDCQVEGRNDLRVRCRFPSAGRYDVKLFANDQQYGSFAYAGSLGVNNDP